MNTKNFLSGILMVVSIVVCTVFHPAVGGGLSDENPVNESNSTVQQSPIEIKKIDVKWLNGERPQLLTAMACSRSAYETLNGTSLNLGNLLGGWHAQAVGQYKDLIYVAFSSGKLSSDKVPGNDSKEPSSEVSKLWIYNTKTKEGFLRDLVKGYPHPCSIQITGKYLTIAIEAEYGISQAALGDKRDQRSMALIFDLERGPKCGVEVGRIVQEGMNSGGAGLTYNPQLKCWFMLVDQDYENGRVALYKTRNENLNSWQETPIAYYPRFGSGAGLNLVTATDNSIWGLWYDSSHDNLPAFSKWEMAGDMVKLFKLVAPDGTPVDQRNIYSQIVNIGSPRVEQAGELLANRPGMRFGAGLRIEGDKLELLTCQRNMAENFKINRTKVSGGARSQVMFVNLSPVKGEFKANSQSNTSKSFSISKGTMESWNEFIPSPVLCDANYISAQSVMGGFGNMSSLGKSTDAIEKTTSAPLALFYLEGTTEVTGKMVEFFPTKKTDKIKLK